MKDNTAFKVGVASFLMAITISLLLIWKSSIFLKASGYEITGIFKSVGGLMNGAEVRYRGLKVGKVFEIEPGATDIKVYFRVDAKVKIPEGSNLKVKFDGLVGEKFLAINPNPAGIAIIPPGSEIHGYASSGLADFIEVGTTNLEKLTEIVETFRVVFTEEGVQDSIKGTLYGVKDIVDNVRILTQQLSALSKDDSIREIIESLRVFSGSMEQLTSKINNSFITDDVADNIQLSAQNFAKFSDHINTLSKRVEVFLLGDEQEDPSTAMNLFKTITSMKIEPGVRLQYSGKEKYSSYTLNLDFDFGKSYIRTGFGDRLEEKTQLLNLQYGWDVSQQVKKYLPVHYMSPRMGLINTKPGFGVDVFPVERLGFEMEFFNFKTLEMDFTTKLELLDQFYAIVNLRKDPLTTNTYDNYTFGISYNY